MAQNIENNNRWREGDPQPVRIGVASATVINVGDIVCRNPSVLTQAIPASALADTGTLLGNQQQLKKYFLGHASQRSIAGETDGIRVNTTGVHEYDCASATFNVGDLIGGAEVATGDALEDQKVVAVTADTAAIGRVEKLETTATTSVYVRIESTIMTSGVQSVVSGS